MFYNIRVAQQKEDSKMEYQIDKTELEKPEKRAELDSIIAAALKSRNVTGDIAYRQTEKRLKALPMLIDRIEDEKEELAELENYGVDGLRHVARSYVSMIKPGMRITPEEAHAVQMARLRAQLNSDELEVRRMKRALALIEDDPYYEIIKQYYYRCKPDSAISYRMNCDTATVGRNRRRLVKKLALRLYGADVLE